MIKWDLKILGLSTIIRREGVGKKIVLCTLLLYEDSRNAVHTRTWLVFQVRAPLPSIARLISLNTITLIHGSVSAHACTHARLPACPHARTHARAHTWMYILDTWGITVSFDITTNCEDNSVKIQNALCWSYVIIYYLYLVLQIKDIQYYFKKISRSTKMVQRF